MHQRKRTRNIAAHDIASFAMDFDSNKDEEKDVRGSPRDNTGEISPNIEQGESFDEHAHRGRTTRGRSSGFMDLQSFNFGNELEKDSERGREETGRTNAMTGLDLTDFKGMDLEDSSDDQEQDEDKKAPLEEENSRDSKKEDSSPQEDPDSRFMKSRGRRGSQNMTAMLSGFDSSETDHHHSKTMGEKEPKQEERHESRTEHSKSHHHSKEPDQEEVERPRGRRRSGVALDQKIRHRPSIMPLKIEAIPEAENEEGTRREKDENDRKEKIEIHHQKEEAETNDHLQDLDDRIARKTRQRSSVDLRNTLQSTGFLQAIQKIAQTAENEHNDHPTESKNQDQQNDHKVDDNASYDSQENEDDYFDEEPESPYLSQLPKRKRSSNGFIRGSGGLQSLKLAVRRVMKEQELESIKKKKMEKEALKKKAEEEERRKEDDAKRQLELEKQRKEEEERQRVEEERRKKEREEKDRKKKKLDYKKKTLELQTGGIMLKKQKAKVIFTPKKRDLKFTDPSKLKGPEDAESTPGNSPGLTESTNTNQKKQSKHIKKRHSVQLDVDEKALRDYRNSVIDRRGSLRRNTLSETIQKMNNRMSKATAVGNNFSSITDVWDSDSDYSFESDKEEAEKDETKNQDSGSKAGKNQSQRARSQSTTTRSTRSFIQNAERELDLVGVKFKSKIETLSKHVAESKLQPLHFDMIDNDDYLPENRLQMVGRSNLYQTVEQGYGPINIIRANQRATMIAIGLANRKLLLYNIKLNKIIQLASSRKSVVTSLDFNDSYNILIVGYESGEVALYGKAKNHREKCYTYNRLLRLRELCQVQAVIEETRLMGEFRAIVINCRDGRVFYAAQQKSGKVKKIEKMKFLFSLVESGLENGAITHLEAASIRGIDFIVQTLGNKARVYVHKYSSKFKGLEKIETLHSPGNKGVTMESFPFFEKVESDGSELNVICIIWGHHVCYYSMYYAKGRLKIPLSGSTEIAVKVQAGVKFDKGLYILLSEEGKLLQYNIKCHVSQPEEQCDREIRMKAKPTTLSNRSTRLPFSMRLTESEAQNLFVDPEASDDVFGNSEIFMELGFQIDTSDMKFIKKGAANHKPCTKMMHCANSQFFIMTKSGLLNYELLDWITYLNMAMSQEKMVFVMKVLNKMLEMSDVCLRSIPKNIEALAEDLKPLMKIFMIKIWPFLLKQDQKTLELITSLSLMLLIKAGMEDYLITDLRETMLGFGLEDYYFKNLMVLFENKMVQSMDELMVERLIEFYEKSELDKKKILYLAFKQNHLRDFAMQKSLNFKYYWLALHFINSFSPPESSIPLNFMLHDFLISCGLLEMPKLNVADEHNESWAKDTMGSRYNGRRDNLMIEHDDSIMVKDDEFDHEDHHLRPSKNLMEVASQHCRASTNVFQTENLDHMNDSSMMAGGGDRLSMMSGISHAGRNRLSRPSTEYDTEIMHMIWYVDKVLVAEKKKEKFNIGEADNAWMVLNWLLDPDTSKKLIQSDCIKFFQGLLLLMNHGIAQELIKIRSPLPCLKNFVFNPDPKILSEDSTLLLRYLFQMLYSDTKGVDDEPAFYFFIAEVLLKNVKGNEKNSFFRIEDGFKFRILDYMVSNLKKILEWEASKPVGKGLGMNEDDVIITIFKIFHKDQELYASKPDFVKSIVKKQKKLGVITELLEYDVKSCFYMFQRLSLDYSPYTEIMFDWIKSDLTNPKTNKKIINLLQEEYLYLIKQDHKQFSEVLAKMSLNSQLEFIMKYKPPTKSKLAIFEQILSAVKEKSLENEITNEFKIVYINLLNHHERSKVLPELKTGRYPLNECLKICEEKNNELAIAYLKERLGFYKEALGIYKKRLKKVLKALTKGDRVNDPKYCTKLFDRMDREFDMAMELVMDSENCNKLLLDFMEFFVITQERYSNFGEIDKWVTLSEKVLKKVLDHIPEKEFIQKIGDPDNYSFIDNNHLMDILVGHFKGFRNMLLSSKYVYGSDLREQDLKYKREHDRGLATFISEDQIKKSSGSDAKMIFDHCKHFYSVLSNMVPPNQKIFCEQCEKEDEARKAENHMLRLWSRQDKTVYPKDFRQHRRSMVTLHNMINSFARSSLNEVNQLDKLEAFDNEMNKLSKYNYRVSGKRRALG